MGNKYQLSIEEVGFIMGYLGEREAAAGYLVGLIGQQNNDNLSGRIVAASHSLVARGILTVGADATDTSLNPDVAALVKTMISSAGSIRCEKQFGDQDDLLTIFMGSNNGSNSDSESSAQKRIAHSITSEVIANIEDLTADGMIEQRIGEFISASDVSAQNASSLNQGDETALGEMPLPVLEEIRGRLNELDLSGVKNRFAPYMAPQIAEALALGLKAETVEWGSVMRLEAAGANAETLLEANTGILYAHTPEGSWLFHIDSEASPQLTTSLPVNVTVYKTSQPLIVKLIKTFV